MKHPICITLGDPAGIGPEITLKALKKIKLHHGIVIILHESLVANFFHHFEIRPFKGDVKKNKIYYILNKRKHHLQQKQDDPNNALFAYDSLLKAFEVCKKYNMSLVTAPISKAGFKAAKIPYTGHTTLLKTYFNAPNASMAFHSDKLAIVLATIHIPLSTVEQSLSTKQLQSTFNNAALMASHLSIKSPRIGVAGLNPHASENGQFGTFETSVLKPAISSTKLERGELIGPISPDVIFRQAAQNEYDIVIAMYHDQGLIPLKLLAFDSAVNVTIGLPICRTSPDHGTAYDIAGKNIANPSSMIAAINYAISIGT